ncbi:hypothetical protein [Pseudoalteromonas aurantia]|uniref:STAS/SEC14 domain-containing protein n=1 Tax=Pseudoalteromonas aurantia 208 TaxID=1314867 RepID=A0ABR9EAU4_9GAMM|nr:hypothetical protein [Pseudoalteromonas aurantia]MBE0368114.1 hypothetical protein [Pseudoalteromonas aurantia 208]
MSDSNKTHQFQYDIITDLPTSIIKVSVKGSGTPTEVINMYDEINRVAKLHNKPNLLLNVVNLKLNYSGSDVLKVMKAIENILLHVRIARVVSPADFKSDLIDLFADNNALEIKSFYSEELAITWLNEP